MRSAQTHLTWFTLDPYALSQVKLTRLSINATKTTTEFQSLEAVFNFFSYFVILTYLPVAHIAYISYYQHGPPRNVNAHRQIKRILTGKSAREALIRRICRHRFAYVRGFSFTLLLKCDIGSTHAYTSHTIEYTVTHIHNCR